MSIILDTRTQSTLKNVQYNGRQDPGGYPPQMYMGLNPVPLLVKNLSK